MFCTEDPKLLENVFSLAINISKYSDTFHRPRGKCSMDYEESYLKPY